MVKSFAGEQVDMGWGQKMFINCIGEGVPTSMLFLIELHFI